MYQVILAGGSGTRFWPQSRSDRPKQFLKIMGDQSMIRMTYNRLSRFTSPQEILVVASEHLCRQIQDEIPEIPKYNYLIEPGGKNTAPAIGLAAIHVNARDANAAMGVYPSDHLIVGDDVFEDTIRAADAYLKDHDALITMGVTPTYPATGYGYIQIDSGVETGNEYLFRVKTFAEKPPRDTAEMFIQSQEFYWNSGMFVWRSKSIINAMKQYMPDLYGSLKAISEFVGTDRYETVLDREWELVQPESIDYGVLEKAENVFTIKADFKWSDLGSWKSVFDYLEKDELRNVFQGNIVSIDTTNSLVISPDRLTALVGVKNLAVINLTDVTLVVPISMAEKVKDMVELLREKKKAEYL